jgi:hypothetical protein
MSKKEEAGFSHALLEPGSEVPKIGASIKRFKIIVQSPKPLQYFVG